MNEAIPKTMKAWEVIKQGPVDKAPFPLKFTTKEVPVPKPGEVLVHVITCGVCHTDLHVTEGDLPVHKDHLTPGHEIVGKVVANGKNSNRFNIGDRIGIPWLRKTCGVCEFCRSGNENLCLNSKYTGWDHDGGYAEYVTVPEGFAYRIPKQFSSVEASPLLCAGIIGYRSLKKAHVPAGGTLGIYGFGGSAHLTAQVAIKQGIEVHVFSRGVDAKKLALKLGATSVNGSYDLSPVKLDSAIIYAPVGDMVPNALKSLKPGGTLAMAGIHSTDIPQMSYSDHIFHEKNLTSVESNTRHDGEEFLKIASRLDITPTVTEYPLEKADQALKDVSNGDNQGAAVLRISKG